MKAKEHENQTAIIKNCAVLRCDACKTIFVSNIFVPSATKEKLNYKETEAWFV